MICYAGATGQYTALALSCVAFTMLIISNLAFYYLYRKDIVADQMFAKWGRMYPKTEKYISLLAVFLNFKCAKLFYSGFYGQESCLA